MKEELTKKLINAMIGNYTCFFSQQEKEYISKLTIGTMSSFEEKKFFYLLVNTQNDLDKESLANVEGVLSHFSFDFDGSHLIHPNERSANFQYTFHQQIIYNHLGKDNFILIAGTGFGKTTIFANYFMQNYKERKGKWVICVPTELLEQQLIMNLREKYEDQNDKIGNNIFKNDILILTPEKLFLAFSAKIKINQIMVDEAHNLLSQNIDRMVFAQKEILKHINKVEHIYFATPFMNKNNLQNFKKIFAGLKLKYISVHSNNNKKNLVLNKSKNFFISIKDEKYFPETQKEYDSPILIYENSKEKCIDLANAEIQNPEKCKIVVPIDMEKELADIRKKFWYQYIPLNLINCGVSYLHSDMPTQVKNIIINLVKKKYIKKIFATNAILNGIDLPFQHVFINRTKIFQRNMKPSDFNNLRGRASRWSESKRGNAFGLAIIKESQSNSKWFIENRDKLNEESSASEIVEDDMTLFVNQSYEKYKKEGREIYLLDPRINPETTKQIEENNFEELENWKELVFYRKNKNKKKLKIFVQNLFKIYQLKLYDKKYRYKNFEDTNSNPEINAANNYCQASFNVDVALQKYIHSPLLQNEKNNNVEWTKKLERSLSRIKTYGKYFFIMFLSHYISIKSKKHFIEYLWYGTFDDDLIEAIQKTQNKEEWISMVNKTEKDDEKVAKRFDKKWKDCQTLTTGGNLAKNDPFISKIIDYIKEDK